MRRLKLNLNGETRLFQADGTVAVIVRGAPVVRGKWRSPSTSANLLHYQLDNVEQPPVPLRHSFNEYNQLVTVIPGLDGGPDSEPCVWLGRIEVDDAHDIGYVLFDDDGTEFSQRLLVRGQLRFAAETADLLIDLAGGGVATITGEKGLDGLSRLSAGQSLVADFDARDLLTFTARTRNDLANRPSRLPVRAKIQFTGHWDIQSGTTGPGTVGPGTGGLVFRSRVAGTTDRPEVAIAFAGQLKAVTAGFAWYADPQGARLALTIAGRHRWNAREAGFELTLGNSERRFLADFKGELLRRGEVGHQFVLSGQVALRHHEKTGPVLAIGIEGEYQVDPQGRLIFRAQVDTAGNYDLQLEGRLVYREGTLSFLMRVGRDHEAPAVRMQIAYQRNREELQTMLAALLLIEKDKVRFELNFEMRMRFKGGVLVRDEPLRLPG